MLEGEPVADDSGAAGLGLAAQVDHLAISQRDGRGVELGRDRPRLVIERADDGDRIAHTHTNAVLPADIHAHGARGVLNAELINVNDARHAAGDGGRLPACEPADREGLRRCVLTGRLNLRGLGRIKLHGGTAGESNEPGDDFGA